MIHLITVKLPRNPDHNPRAKVVGPCPVTGLPCTDVTGEHHTFAVVAEDAAKIMTDMALLHGHVTRAALLYGHVTRVETVELHGDVVDVANAMLARRRSGSRSRP